MSTITVERYILALRKTPVLLKALLKGITQEQAQQYKDGPDGWTVVQTMCHIRDHAEVSLKRVHRMLEEDKAPLIPMNPQEYMQRRDYTRANLEEEVAAYIVARKALIAFLTGLAPEQWKHEGIHPEYGPISMLEMAVFITWHDLNHIEQIARSLNLAEAVV